jgi:hypothetical protein
VINDALAGTHIFEDPTNLVGRSFRLAKAAERTKAEGRRQHDQMVSEKGAKYTCMYTYKKQSYPKLECTPKEIGPVGVACGKLYRHLRSCGRHMDEARKSKEKPEHHGFLQGSSSDRPLYATRGS